MNKKEIKIYLYLIYYFNKGVQSPSLQTVFGPIRNVVLSSDGQVRLLFCLQSLRNNAHNHTSNCQKIISTFQS